MRTAMREMMPRPSILVPIPAKRQKDRNWNVILDGRPIPHVETLTIDHPTLGTLTYGDTPAGHDGWTFHETGGGGAVTLPFYAIEVAPEDLMVDGDKWAFRPERIASSERDRGHRVAEMIWRGRFFPWHEEACVSDMFSNAAVARLLVHLRRVGRNFRRLQPRCLAMCGVCAGRRGDVNLGDVIVADRVWQYDFGALKVSYSLDGKRHERYQADITTYQVPPE